MVQTLLPSQLRDIILLCFPYILTLGPNEIFLFNDPLLPTLNTAVGLVTGKSIRWRAAATATAQQLMGSAVKINPGRNQMLDSGRISRTINVLNHGKGDQGTKRIETLGLKNIQVL